MGYASVESLLNRIDNPNGATCRRILAHHRELFATVQGSTNNHQAWRGGYLDHVSEVMNIGVLLSEQLSAERALPFSLFPAASEDSWTGASRVARE